jgi:hypothetical protein
MEDIALNMPSLKKYGKSANYLHKNNFCALNSLSKLLKFNI